MESSELVLFHRSISKQNKKEIIHIVYSILSPCTQLYNIIYDCKLHKQVTKKIKQAAYKYTMTSK